jgi:hypothetical protein
LYLRHLFKANNTPYKIILAVIYPFFLFSISYNFGRHLGNFISLPGNINKLLNLQNGDSIQALQTKLIIKRCLFEEISSEKNKISQEKKLDSFIFNQIFGESIRKMKNFKELLAWKINKNK